MLNLNSPTVQAMLGNTPQGYGNMPVYYGNTPTVTQQTTQPVNGIQTPFPSPKEMLTQGGQQMIYSPTGFAPRNIVGGYNPGYNAAFAGYSNPYMGYGAYGGYYHNMAPMDEDSRERDEMAKFNGFTYDEQLKEESKLYKTISRIVSKNVGRTEKQTEECAAAFDIYCKYPTQDPMQRKKVKPMHIRLKVGDNIVADKKPKVEKPKEESENLFGTPLVADYAPDYIRNAILVNQMREQQAWREAEKVRRNNMIYERAPERAFDKTDLLDFFNNGAGVLMADSLARIVYEQSIGRTTEVYDRDG